MYEINTATLTPDNFFAGDFPIAKEIGIVDTGKTVKKYEPVKMVAGKIQPVVFIDATTEPEKTAEENTSEGLYGIAAEAATEGTEVVVYLTGEFFAASIEWPENVTEAMLKPYFRKLGIFLK